jgi:hypothetical protein
VVTASTSLRRAVDQRDGARYRRAHPFWERLPLHAADHNRRNRRSGC